MCGCKDIGMTIRKNFVVLFLPCSAAFHPYMFFLACFGGGGVVVQLQLVAIQTITFMHTKVIGFVT